MNDPTSSSFLSPVAAVRWSERRTSNADDLPSGWTTNASANRFRFHPCVWRDFRTSSSASWWNCPASNLRTSCVSALAENDIVDWLFHLNQLNWMFTWASLDVRLLVVLLLFPRMPEPCANRENTESVFLGGDSRSCDNAKREPCVSSCYEKRIVKRMSRNSKKMRWTVDQDRMELDDKNVSVNIQRLYENVWTLECLVIRAEWPSLGSISAVRINDQVFDRLSLSTSCVEERERTKEQRMGHMSYLQWAGRSGSWFSTQRGRIVFLNRRGIKFLCRPELSGKSSAPVVLWRWCCHCIGEWSKWLLLAWLLLLGRPRNAFEKKRQTEQKIWSSFGTMARSNDLTALCISGQPYCIQTFMR